MHLLPAGTGAAFGPRWLAALLKGRRASTEISAKFAAQRGFRPQRSVSAKFPERHRMQLVSGKVAKQDPHHNPPN